MPPLNLPSQQLPPRCSSTRPSHTRSNSSPSVLLSLLIAFGASSFSSSPGSSPGAHIRSSSHARSRLLKRHSTSLEKMQEDEEPPSMARQPSSLSLRNKPSSEHSHLHSSTQPPSRQPSFSKRHASFSSPREVPLPSPSSNTTSQLTGYPFPVTAPQQPRVAPPGSKGLAGDCSQTSPHTPSHRESHVLDSLASDTSSISLSQSSIISSPELDSSITTFAASDHSEQMKHTDGFGSHSQPDTREASPAPEQRQHTSQFHEPAAPQSAPILPFSRPYSLPDSHTKGYASIAQAGPSQPGNWIDRTSTASLPLPSQTPYNLLPRVGDSSASNAPMYRNHNLQSLFAEASERRPLPAPPSINTVQDDPKPSTSQHPPTPSEPAWTPQTTPSSPPPPYSRFLSPEEPIPSTRSLSRTTSTMPAPEAPVILSPPPQNEGPGDAQRRAPYNSFLCHAQPPDTWIAVETFESEYRLVIRLPGFRRDGITIATRRRRILHVVADSWEPGGGHFERRVSFGYDADLAQVRAEFDGQMLRIIIPRHVTPVSWRNAQ